MSYLILLHYYTKLLRVSLHQMHCLIVHIHVLHLCCCVVRVVVRLKMPAINVVSNMPPSCRKVLNEIPLLQGSVPHQAS